LKLVVDNLSATTGWTASGGSSSIYGTNSLAPYVAGNNSTSLLLYFSGLNSYCQKTLGTNVTNYNEITLHIWSRTYGEQEYKTASDFSYKIDFGTDKEYYLPAFKTFHHVTIDISDIDTLDRIRITALTANVDYLNISYLVASTDEFPLDVFAGIKEQIEYIRTQRSYDTLYSPGTISGTTGDLAVAFSDDVNWLQRYAIIKIDDGVNSEIHQIERKEGNAFYFNDMYDGASLENDYTDANCYLYLPIEFGVDDSEIILPGITVWGIVPDKLRINNETDYIIDSYKTDDTFKQRQEGQYLKYVILIDCEARQQEILAVLSEMAKIFIGQKQIWVNGRKVFVDYEGIATEIEQNEVHNIIPKLQYLIKVEIKEEIYQRQTLNKFDTLTHTVTIM